MPLAELVSSLGGRFSLYLGVRLAEKEEKELFRWLLASSLLGAPIREGTAVKAFKAINREASSPSDVIKLGWDRIVELLDISGYTRYDFKTADKLIEMSNNLIERYGGSLNRMHDEAEDSISLEFRVRGLAKGIGPETVVIFLRELRGIWKKANPPLSSLAFLAAKNIGIRAGDKREAVKELLSMWEEEGGDLTNFVDLESALVRLGRDYCKKKKCSICPASGICSSR
jgi:endonuclease III